MLLLEAHYRKKLWTFLVDDVEGEDWLMRNVKEILNANDSGIHAFLIHPYVQTNLFISECLNLELKPLNALIRLSEGSGRKDRFSSSAYANYLCSLFDKDLLKEGDNNDDDWDVLSGLTQFV